MPGDRTQFYLDAMSWIELREAQGAQSVFHNYLVENRIFMTEELRDKFAGIDNDLIRLLIDHEGWKQFAEMGLRQASLGRIAKIEEKIGPLEEAVQRRLEYGHA